MERLSGQPFDGMLHCVGRDLVRAPRYLNRSIVAKYLTARRHHQALAGIAIEISKGTESERRRELPRLVQYTLLRVLMRLHLHDSGRGPRRLVTKFAPNSDLHRFSHPLFISQ